MFAHKFKADLASSTSATQIFDPSPLGKVPHQNSHAAAVVLADIVVPKTTNKMMRLSVYALVALASVAGVRALDADAADKERNLFWASYVQNVDSFPSVAPSPAPSGKLL